jgi:hypothetical protein
LLSAKKKLIDEGIIYKKTNQPIQIGYFTYVNRDVLLNLYNGCCSCYEDSKKIIQSMKKDYSSLIGESVKINRNYSNQLVKTMDNFIGTKLSLEIQRGNL